jgi:alkanesulfonate monooxygenase SsuD/methylene tetrahydromethanopterin reductase-like flavin-dependent oxidoreductase (luciferase family)
MEIAVWDSVEPRPGTSHADLYREHLAEIAVAEECGYQHYWFLEHHLTPSCPLPSPNLFIAAAAQHTRRIRLGNMVNVLPFRNPVVLAEEIAMLDTLTGGRLDVGIGRGLKPTEFETFGVVQDESREMFLEALDVMLGVWQHDTFSHQGRYFFVDKRTPLSPPLVQRPHPPLYVSAQSRESLRWAAERDVPFGQIDAPVRQRGAAARPGRGRDGLAPRQGGGPNSQYTLLQARRPWVLENRAVVVRFLRAIMRGNRWLYDPANRADAEALFRQELGADAATTAAIYDLYLRDVKVYQPDAEPLLSHLRGNVDLLLEVQAIEPPAPNPEQYLELGPLREAQASLGAR